MPRSRECLLAFLAVLVTCVVALGVLGFGKRTGDGSEYYLMMINWAETGTPYTTLRSDAIYGRFIASHPENGWFYSPEKLSAAFANLVDNQGRMDLNHFWFYSLLAAAFYHPLELADFNIGYAFTLLHLSLLSVAVVLAVRAAECRSALALLGMVLTSPALWYLDKAHTEMFTVIATCLAMVYLLQHRPMHAALWFAIAGTQNPPFSIVALFALGMGLHWYGWKTITHHAVATITTGVLLCLHPVYYLWRQGVLTPQAGGHGADFGSNLVSWKYLTYTLVDPDVGLLLNWAPALPLLGVLLYLLATRRMKISPDWAIFICATLFVLALSHAATTNYNHGGTRSISRYALWYLFLLLPALVHIAHFLLDSRGARQWLGMGIAAMLFVPAAALNWPGRGQGYLYHSGAATVLYRYVPRLYDPIPEIFEERTGHSWEGNGGPRAWALSNDAGTKILVYKDRIPPAGQPTLPVFGNAALSGERVRTAANTYFSSHPHEVAVYLNTRAAELASAGP